MALVAVPRIRDVCVVGSGAGGGMAARVLAEAGADVVMLEAGPAGDTARADASGWQIEGEPYSVAPGSRFRWFRGRGLGGRTNHWGRLALRFGPWDLAARSRDGLGDDWPISYEDLAPYYDRLDRMAGVFGSNEGLENEPDGIFLPPPRPRCYELAFRQVCSRLGVPAIASRLARAGFSSTSALLPPALASGRLEIVSGAMARLVTTDAEGRASGVSYVDAATGADGHVRARSVVLAASACESARILLNSRSTVHPNGLANSSGAVGRHLTGSVGVRVRAFVPSLAGLPPHDEGGIGGMHVYVPWWLDNRTLGFPRGYHVELDGGRHLPAIGFGAGIHKVNGGGYGQQLKAEYRRFYGAFLDLNGRGEMVPDAASFCEIDKGTVDRFGIPVLRFHWRWSEHELRMAAHMQETLRSIVAAMGGRPLDPQPGPDEDLGISVGGSTMNEAGTTRMGTSPRTSVLDGWCRAHDCRNLFVADAGSFVSSPHKNATWTIQALAMRTAEHVVFLRRRGEL